MSKESEDYMITTIGKNSDNTELSDEIKNSINNIFGPLPNGRNRLENSQIRDGILIRIFGQGGENMKNIETFDAGQSAHVSFPIYKGWVKFDIEFESDTEMKLKNIKFVDDLNEDY